MKNLFKTTCIILCTLVFTHLAVKAQVKTKLKDRISSNFTYSKNNAVITFPVAGSIIDGPAVYVGKAEPNATITLVVTPIYKVPKSKIIRPLYLDGSKSFTPQTFTFIANAKGVWESPLIEVKFDKKATDKKVQINIMQQWGTNRSTGKTYLYPTSQELEFIVTAPVKMPQKNNESANTSGQPKSDPGVTNGINNLPFSIASPKNNAYVAHNNFTVTGIAPPSTTLWVEVRYSGYKSTSNVTIYNFGPIFLPGVDRNTKVVNNELWGTYRVNSRGLWTTEAIKFIKKIGGYSCWANTYTITASLIDENGLKVRPTTIQVTRMNTVSVK